MAPKMKAAKASEVTGTKEEDAEADKLIAAASSQQLHSICSAMNNFLRSNPDDVVRLAEGPLKKKVLKELRDPPDSLKELAKTIFQRSQHRRRERRPH